MTGRKTIIMRITNGYVVVLLAGCKTEKQVFCEDVRGVIALLERQL